MEPPKITALNFVLAVPDGMKTARWWVDVMKFDSLRDLGGWVFVKRGPCMIMLGSCPDAIPVPDLGDHQYFGYIEFDDVDAYFAEIEREKVDLIKQPRDEEWGMREFAVRTPGGHRVMFGQDLENRPNKRQLSKRAACPYMRPSHGRYDTDEHSWAG